MRMVERSDSGKRSRVRIAVTGGIVRPRRRWRWTAGEAERRSVQLVVERRGRVRRRGHHVAATVELGFDQRHVVDVVDRTLSAVGRRGTVHWARRRRGCPDVLEGHLTAAGVLEAVAARRVAGNGAVASHLERGGVGAGWTGAPTARSPLRCARCVAEQISLTASPRAGSHRRRVAVVDAGRKRVETECGGRAVHARVKLLRVHPTLTPLPEHTDDITALSPESSVTLICRKLLRVRVTKVKPSNCFSRLERLVYLPFLTQVLHP